MAPMMIRIRVSTMNSPANVSLTSRMASATRRRPAVKLAARKSATPAIVPARRPIPTSPARTIPRMTAMRIQHSESSIIEEATMICPRSRREVHVTHHCRYDLDRRDRQGDAEEERHREPLPAKGGARLRGAAIADSEHGRCPENSNGSRQPVDARDRKNVRGIDFGCAA